MGWLDAHRAGLHLTVNDPNSWVLQIQGPRSFDVLAKVLDDPLPEPLNYFDVTECRVAGEPFLISRSGWTGEAGVELYSLNPSVDVCARVQSLDARGCGRKSAFQLSGKYGDPEN